jgi:hypothetical protein
MDEAAEYLQAEMFEMGWAFVRPASHPGRILVVLDGDMARLEDILNEADETDDVWQVSDEAVLAWINNADLEEAPMTDDGDEYHAKIRSQWLAAGRSLT